MDTSHSFIQRTATELTKPKLFFIGFLGMFVESLLPGLPFGICTSTGLIATIVYTHHWNISDKSVQDKLQFSWIGLLVTGLATVLSIGLGLDMLNGHPETEHSDFIGWLPSTTWFFSIVGILGASIISQKNNSEMNWIGVVLESVLHTCKQSFVGLKDTISFNFVSNEQTETIELKDLFANVLLPITAVSIFVVLYGGINDAFEASTGIIFDWMVWGMNQWTALFFQLPLSTLLLGTMILAIIIPTFSNKYINPSAWLEIENDFSTELDNLEQQLVEPADSFRNQIDISTITPTLIVLNALLLWFHTVDLYTIISSDLTDAAVLSQNVHACLSRVFIATAASIGIILLPSNDSQKSSHLFWAKSWIVNNGIFSLWAIIKVGMYIGICGLTTRRIAILGVFIGLGLTVKACYKMIATSKNATWIFNKAIEHQYACMVVGSVVATLIGLWKFM